MLGIVYCTDLKLKSARSDYEEGNEAYRHAETDVFAPHNKKITGVLINVYNVGLPKRAWGFFQAVFPGKGFEFRDLTAEKYAAHVSDPSTFAWRPLALQETVRWCRE